MLQMVDLLRYIELRTIVLALGEVHHSGWWKSQFLSSTGLSIFDRLYPTSGFAECVRSATLGAMEVHDTNIGKGRVFHLYRLSQNTERELERVLSEQGQSLDIKYKNLLDDKERLMVMLVDLADKKNTPATLGPILLRTTTERMVPLLAAHYLQAFQQGSQVFPYFEEIH